VNYLSNTCRLYIICLIVMFCCMSQSMISLMKQQFVVTHNLSDWDSHHTRQLGCKHSFCQNFVFTKNYFCLYFRVTCISFGLLRICQVISVSRKINVSGLWQIAVLWAIFNHPGQPSFYSVCMMKLCVELQPIRGLCAFRGWLVNECNILWDGMW
jgi:hypothetical protein